jgi:hypothetical protein
MAWMDLRGNLPADGGLMTTSIRCYSPTPYPQPLPPGTRVERLHGGQRGIVGTTQTFERFGIFPVDWADGFSELCGADDVRVIPPRVNKAAK